MLDDPEYCRWQRAADDALGAARAQHQAGYHHWTCFLAEQAAQLAVEGLLHGAGQGAWGHDLVELGRRAGVVAGAADAAVEDALRRLSRHNLATRYPDANPGGTPGEHYGPADAEGACADAATVRAFVETAWAALEEADGPP